MDYEPVTCIWHLLESNAWLGHAMDRAGPYIYSYILSCARQYMYRPRAPDDAYCVMRVELLSCISRLEYSIHDVRVFTSMMYVCGYTVYGTCRAIVTEYVHSTAWRGVTTLESARGS